MHRKKKIHIFHKNHKCSLIVQFFRLKYIFFAFVKIVVLYGLECYEPITLFIAEHSKP